MKTSVGAEGSLDIVVGFGLPLTLDGRRRVDARRRGEAGGTGGAVYFRIGPSF